MTSTLKQRLARTITGLLAATVLVASAAAQQAYTTRQVNLRAGPDRGYPQVAYVRAGQSVDVNGCIDDYRWCDITAGPNRGWAYSKFIEYPYQDRRVLIYDNGPTLALPIVSFILGSYWNDNYRNRPWYGQQDNWNDWRPGNRPPPVWGNGYRPPRPPVVRPQPPRPPYGDGPQIQPPRPPYTGGPQIQPPRPPVVRPQPPRPPRPPQTQFPQQQGPGASRPSGSMNQ